MDLLVAVGIASAILVLMAFLIVLVLGASILAMAGVYRLFYGARVKVVEVSFAPTTGDTHVKEWRAGK